MNAIPASIVALGLVVGGFLAGGRYDIAPMDGGAVARLDRFTGKVAMCVPGTRAECEWMLDPPSGRPERVPPTITDDQMRALERSGVAKNSN